jgi:alkaline phosphatase D
MQRQCPIMATWDDHDYGANDAGNDFYLRKESQTAFLDFYGFGDNSRTRQQEGIYHSQMFGPAGRRVQVIMLDTRYNRDTLEFKAVRVPGRGPYQPTQDSSKTILGQEQWSWLEMELRREADIRIIASSIQVVADEHGYETWGNFPAERERLYGLIAKTQASGVVFVSGDRHLMEISRDTKRGNPPYAIWDFTSSGLNQRPEVVNDPNQFRVGPVSREPNFGIIRIEWGKKSRAIRINLEGVGDQGQMLTRQTLFLNELRPSNGREADRSW